MERVLRSRGRVRGRLHSSRGSGPAGPPQIAVFCVHSRGGPAMTSDNPSRSRATNTEQRRRLFPGPPKVGMGGTFLFLTGVSHEAPDEASWPGDRPQAAAGPPTAAGDPGKPTATGIVTERPADRKLVDAGPGSPRPEFLGLGRRAPA